MRRTPLLPLIALPLAAALALGSGSTPTAAPAPVEQVSSVPLGITSTGLDALLDPGQEPGDAMLSRVGGTVPPGAWARANAQAKAAAVRTAAVDPALAAAEWELRGPTNIGGRLLDVVVDPRKVDSVFVAAASGGIWHTEDGGKTFEPAWPADNNQAVGALAISPKGVLWAGTGEAGPGGGSITYGGDGIWRSDDFGKTWRNVGLKLSERIGRIVVDPTDEDVVWVASNGSLFRGGGEDRGLYRTSDGGQTWELMLAGETPTTGAVDVALDPKTPSTIYMTMWDRIREPDRRIYTGVGTGAFKSTDNGKTWARIGLPLLAPNPPLGRLGIAVAPSDPNRVYILASTEAGLTAGLARSEDGGATFTPAVDIPLVTGGFVYAWWFGRVYVDPLDPDHVFATGVNMSESFDGGVTFSASGGLHADQHAMAWDLRIPGRVYVGNDGGFYRSDDNGTTFEHGEYMPWNQLFSVDVSQQDSTKVLGGLQDNGGVRNYTSEEDPAADGFNDITGGDGTEMAFAPHNDEFVYGCSQYGVCARSTNGGGNMSSFENEILGVRKNWLTPIEFDPNDSSLVYTASEIVHRSTDEGASWTPISPDLTSGFGRETNPLFRNYGTVTTIAAAEGASETPTIYAGTDDGRLWYTHSGGGLVPGAWTEATGLPGDWVTSVAIDYRDSSNVAYATFSGFRSGNQKSMVYRTVDGGVTWTDISGDLPQAPVNDVLPVGDDVVVATDVGVFVSRAMSKGPSGQWLKVGGNLPAAPITDVKWHVKDTLLFAANFGRGAFAISLPQLGMLGPITAAPPVVTPPVVAPPVDAAPLPATGLPTGLAVLGLTVMGAAVLTRRRLRT
ncbi:MAG: hypothetical protein Q8R60_09640 [Mycobacteriales bacterium]|nr:hypothetical protein [Mycobacteriales bacterium]